MCFFFGGGRQLGGGGGLNVFKHTSFLWGAGVQSGSAKGRKNAHSPQRGEWAGRGSRDLF